MVKCQGHSHSELSTVATATGNKHDSKGMACLTILTTFARSFGSRNGEVADMHWNNWSLPVPKLRRKDLLYTSYELRYGRH